MKTPQELFEDGCTEWGMGPKLNNSIAATVGFKEVSDLAATWISQVGKLPVVNNLIPIHFDFIDADALNAVADIRQGTGLIGLLAGAWALPVDLFTRLLTHPQVLPMIGNAGAESIGPQHADGVVQTVGTLIQKRQLEGRPLKVQKTSDPARLACQQLLIKIFYDFLICHELGHIVNGHVGYVLDSVGIRYMLEIVSSGSTPAAQDPVIRQALEMDADAAAAALSLGVVASAIQGDHPKEWELFSRSAEEILYLWSFAIGCLFYLWGLKINFNEFSTHEHPPTGLRFIMTMATADEILKQKQPNLYAAFQPIHKRVFGDVLRAMAAIGGKVSEAELQAFARGAIDPRSTAHISLLKSTWTTIRPDVMKHSYHQRLAP